MMRHNLSRLDSHEFLWYIIDTTQYDTRQRREYHMITIVHPELFRFCLIGLFCLVPLWGLWFSAFFAKLGHAQPQLAFAGYVVIGTKQSGYGAAYGVRVG